MAMTASQYPILVSLGPGGRWSESSGAGCCLGGLGFDVSGVSGAVKPRGASLPWWAFGLGYRRPFGVLFRSSAGTPVVVTCYVKARSKSSRSWGGMRS